MSDWIPITKREPEMHQKVLIWTTDADGDYVHNLAHWNGKATGFLVYGGHRDPDVTHWMPLPEPPENDHE